MWLSPILLMAIMAKLARAIPEPGILRVPKVYNAVITSNQNLAPSRAYPVIQPVVHRTAIGYVPPYYYTEIGPGFAGPGFVQLDPGPKTTTSSSDDNESIETLNNPESGISKKISRPLTGKNANDEFSDENTSSDGHEENSSSTNKEKQDKKITDSRVPLNFYPNYRSTYYDPYFNPYNAFPLHNLATPGTYYVDYPQPPGIFGPALLPRLPLQPLPSVFPISPIRPGTTTTDLDDERETNPPKRRSDRQKSHGTEKRENIRNLTPSSSTDSAKNKDS